MGRGRGPGAGAEAEAECRICYEAFGVGARGRRVLSCGHGACGGCLRRLAEGSGSPGRLRCPFCRREALLPAEEGGGRRPPSLRPLSAEVLLCPGILEPFAPGGGPDSASASSSSSSDCLVVTLLEVPEELSAPEGLGLLEVMRLYRPPSLASLPGCQPPLAKCPACRACPALPRCLLALLCLLYFSSLPLGIYLLLAGRLGLGIALVSLVPATLILCIFYSLCQCLRHEILELPS